MKNPRLRACDLPAAAWVVGPALGALLLAGCAVPPVTNDGRRVTIEHDAAMAADEVAAQAMRACQQAGKANAAFESMDNLRRAFAPGTGRQSSTYRCTP